MKLLKTYLDFCVHGWAWATIDISGVDGDRLKHYGWTMYAWNTDEHIFTFQTPKIDHFFKYFFQNLQNKYFKFQKHFFLFSERSKVLNLWKSTKMAHTFQSDKSLRFGWDLDIYVKLW